MTAGILVTGGGGQVARWIAESAPDRVDTLTRTELDITDAAAVDRVLRDRAPELVIHCGAYTAVDAAESDAERAMAVNRDGARNVAAAAHRLGARMVHVSTDYVFGESRVSADPLAVDHPTAPTSVYGSTKLAGEHAVRAAHPEATIVRTAWVYTGPHRRSLGLAGDDFVTTMLRLEATRETLSVVDDQTGSPTYARDLAAGLLAASSCEAAVGRTLHAGGAGRATWCDLARAVFVEAGADPERVRPCTTEEFPRPASRPAYSVLSSGEWAGCGLEPLRDWRVALAAAMHDDVRSAR